MTDQQPNEKAYLVVFDQLLGKFGHVGGLDRIHLFGASLGSKNGENAAAWAPMKNCCFWKPDRS